jgi:hypothetical protein
MKKNQQSGDAMKELLNPTKKTNDKLWNRKNLEDLKLIEEKKKRNKEQKEIEKEILHKNDKYKLEQFKNIPSKLKENTKNWITNEKSKLKPINKGTPLNKIKNKSQSKPMTSVNTKKPLSEIENIYNMNNNGPQSMFDKYYANKIRAKSPSSIIRPFEVNKDNENIYDFKNDLNTDINNVNININNDKVDNNNVGKANVENLIKEYKEKYGEDEELNKMIKDYNNNINLINSEKNTGNINTKKSTNVQNNSKAINNKKKDVHKAPTPTIKDAPIILPKIHKNYIRENRQLVMDNKVPSKNKFVEEKNDVKHKDYGKVPDYIKKYEIEREQQKEEKKKQQEASKYPKGTKLLSEEERVSTLNGLINSRKEMINLLEKMPITTRTLSIQNKKEELIKKIEEVEKAIEMFSKKQVFIKA